MHLNDFSKLGRTDMNLIFLTIVVYKIGRYTCANLWYLKSAEAQIRLNLGKLTAKREQTLPPFSLCMFASRMRLESPVFTRPWPSC